MRVEFQRMVQAGSLSGKASVCTRAAAGRTLLW